MTEDNVITPQVHFRAVLPPDFTGDGNESFSQWARRFQVCCETSGMDKPQLANVLPSRLAAFTASDEPYFRGRSPVSSSISQPRPQGIPSSGYHQQHGYDRAIFYENRDTRFRPRRGYAAYEDSYEDTSTQLLYRHYSKADSSPRGNRDRRRAGDGGQSSVQMSVAQSDNAVTPEDSTVWTPYVKGLIEDQEVSVFLDTGAGLSLISEALRQHIPALGHRPLLKSFQVSVPPLTEIVVPASVACVSESGSQLHGFQDLSQSLSVDIAQCQKDDVTLRTVIEWLKDGRRPPSWVLKKGSAELKVYWRQFDRLHLQDEKIYRFACNKPKESPTLHVVIPSKAVPEVLQFLHGHSTVGHLGH
ncbi:uncharacterized protein LOC106603732 [Tachysurus ichikawai]